MALSLRDTKTSVVDFVEDDNGKVTFEDTLVQVNTSNRPTDTVMEELLLMPTSNSIAQWKLYAKKVANLFRMEHRRNSTMVNVFEDKLNSISEQHPHVVRDQLIQEQVRELVIENKGHQDNIDNLQLQLNQANEQVQELHQTIDHQDDQLDTITRNRDLLQLQLNQANDQIQELQQQLQQQQETVNSLRTKVTGERKVVDNIHTNFNNVLREKRVLQAKYNEQVQLNQGLRQSLQSSQEEVKCLQDTLSRNILEQYSCKAGLKRNQDSLKHIKAVQLLQEDQVRTKEQQLQLVESQKRVKERQLQLVVNVAKRHECFLEDFMEKHQLATQILFKDYFDQHIARVLEQEAEDDYDSDISPPYKRTRLPDVFNKESDSE